MKVKTSAGFACTIDEEALGDWEIVEKLIDVQKGNVAVLPDIMTELIGEKGYLAAKDFVRTEKGRVPTQKLTELFFEVLTEARRASADKKK